MPISWTFTGYGYGFERKEEKDRYLRIITGSKGVSYLWNKGEKEVCRKFGIQCTKRDEEDLCF